LGKTGTFFACEQDGVSRYRRARQGAGALVLSPPLVIPEDDLDRALAIVEGCLAEAGS
jgi:4-aminobutyrate aminotransferase-like enzyme